MSKSNKKSKKKYLLFLLFVLINIAVIAITASSEFGNSENAAKLSEIQIKWWLLIPAVIVFVVAIILEIYKYVILMRKTGGNLDKKKTWKVARRTILIGKYYDNITPAAIGGQPFQIYYMNKSGLPSGTATTIPIVGMISGQIGFMIVAVISFLIGSYTISNAPLIATACFGLLFYAFWPIAVFTAAFLPKATTEIITLGVKFLAKLHIVKNKQEAIEKTERSINEYTKCIKQILKTRGLFAKTIIFSIILHVLISCIPFFVITAFGGEINFISCFVTTVAVTSAVYFIPTPGNSGAAEGTFYVVFSALSSGYIFWAMLTWRFFSYYIYIIMGGIAYFIMYLEKMPMDHWARNLIQKAKNIFSTSKE